MADVSERNLIIDKESEVTLDGGILGKRSVVNLVLLRALGDEGVHIELSVVNRSVNVKLSQDRGVDRTVLNQSLSLLYLKLDTISEEIVLKRLL